MSESHNRISPSTGVTKADLLAQTRDMVASYDGVEISQDNTARQIADNFATLQDREHMTLREIGEGVGKSHTWVKVMLDWRAGGFCEARPFAARSKASREKAKLETRVSNSVAKSAAVKLGNGEVVKSLDGFSEAAKRQIAAAAGNDVDVEASTQAMKSAHASADAPSSDAPTSKSKAASGGDTTQIKRGSQEHWLSEFRIAYKAYFPKMDAATVAKAKAEAAAWQPEQHLKVVA
jgi:hypothetical protein